MEYKIRFLLHLGNSTMAIFVVGISYKNTPIVLREQAYFPSDKWGGYLQDLLNRELAREALLLSTCNRTELYCEADDLEVICAWLYEKTSCPVQCWQQILYHYQQERAVAHMMRVACGLDSMILGEPQIIGQMKTAFSEAVMVGAIGSLFHHLFKQIFALTKEIRTTTTLGACPVSVATTAIQVAKQVVPVFQDATVAIIGSGDTARLLLCHLKTQLNTSIIMISRNREKAVRLVQKQGTVYSLAELDTALLAADIIFTVTGSLSPILTLSTITPLMHRRKQKPLYCLDLAMPRDIDPQVGTLPHVTLYCLDDLVKRIEANRQHRSHAAVKAEEMIQQRSTVFFAEYASLQQMTDAICAYRTQMEELCHHELLKAKQQLNQGIPPYQVLEQFAHALTKKFLHVPSTQLRQASLEGQSNVLQLAKRLFALVKQNQRTGAPA